MKRWFSVILFTSMLVTSFNIAICAQGKIYSDKDLIQLALQKGVIPSNANQDYLKQQMAKGASLRTWILFNRRMKASVVDNIKSKFEERDIVVSKPTEFYIDQINTSIYKAIDEGRFNKLSRQGLIGIFRSVAVVHNDLTADSAM